MTRKDIEARRVEGDALKVPEAASAAWRWLVEGKKP